jgi:hypothetical protein
MRLPRVAIAIHAAKIHDNTEQKGQDFRGYIAPHLAKVCGVNTASVDVAMPLDQQVRKIVTVKLDCIGTLECPMQDNLDDLAHKVAATIDTCIKSVQPRAEKIWVFVHHDGTTDVGFYELAPVSDPIELPKDRVTPVPARVG